MPETWNRTIRKALGELPLFADLDPEHLDQLAKATRSIACSRAQAIYQAGDPCSEIYVLVSGQVTLSLFSNRGDEKVIEVLEAGQSFGEAELFGTRSYSIGAVAVRPSQVLGISRDSFLHIMTKDPRVALRVIEVLARRQIGMETELATRRFHSSGRRVLDFMLQLAGPQRDPDGETVVTLNISKKLLASRFDMQPETLSRTLRDLTKAGLIVVDHRQIRLRNVAIERYLDDEIASQEISLPRLRRLPRMAGNGYRARTPSFAAREQFRESRSHCDSINMAGRQRMLSQRMVKSWLMLERGLLPRQSRLILNRSMDMFDSHLQELAFRATSAESSSTCAELAGLWPQYRGLLDAAPCRKTAQKLFGINEEVLDAAQRLTVSFEKADGTAKGKLVNLAGRERMLSQRMAKLFMFRQMGIKAVECRSELEETREEFSAALVELKSVAQGKSGILDELASVTEHWNTLQSTMATLNDLDFAPTACKVFMTSENLLRHMDTAVDLYIKLPDPEHAPCRDSFALLVDAQPSGHEPERPAFLSAGGAHEER